MKKVLGFVLLGMVLVCLGGVVAGYAVMWKMSPVLDGICDCREPEWYYSDFIEDNCGGGSNAAMRAILQCGETQRTIGVWVDEETTEQELSAWTQLARQCGVPQITFNLPMRELEDYLKNPNHWDFCPMHYEIDYAVAYFNCGCNVEDFDVLPLSFDDPRWPTNNLGPFDGGRSACPLMLSSDALRPGGRVAFGSVYMRLKGNPALEEHGVEAMSDEAAEKMMERLRAIAEKDEFPLPIFIRDSWTGKVRFIIAPHGKSLTTCNETPKELAPPPEGELVIF